MMYRMYKFSAPMPYSTDNINKLLDINKQVEKSAITSLYMSLPSSCNLFTGFEQHRNFMLNQTDWDYWKNLAEFILNKNIDFIYLINSPAHIYTKTPKLERQLDKLDILLNELRKIGVNKLRVANHKLISYLHKNYSDFDLYASTSFEFKLLMEYKNFMFIHPYVKQVVPSHDLNKNFKFLKNLKNLIPDIDIEIMINEGCINACPVRNLHAESIMDEFKEENDNIFSNYYAPNYFCIKMENFPIYELTRSNVLYPWDIEEYSKIGINKFKLVGRDGYNNFNDYIRLYTAYLKGIDDIKFIQNHSLSDFTHHLKSNPILKQLKVKDYIKYLPQISYFKKYGHFCASRCGVECRYCYKCAEKIQKVFENKQQEQMKRNISVCVMDEN